jgi:hypothetical protein
MQEVGVQFNVAGQGGIEVVLLDIHWGRVRGAMDALLMTFHSEEQEGSEVLEDIFDYFVQKVEFDSPLAVPE